MLARNVLNPAKKGKLIGNQFHVFMDQDQWVWYDSDLVERVAWGSKPLILKWVKQVIPRELGEDADVFVNFYMRTEDHAWRNKLQYRGKARSIVVLNG